MGRRNHLVRTRMAKCMADGVWRTAAQIGGIFSSHRWSYRSNGQLGNLLARTPGFDRRKVGHRSSVYEYQFTNRSAFDEFMRV